MQKIKRIFPCFWVVFMLFVQSFSVLAADTVTITLEPEDIYENSDKDDEFCMSYYLSGDVPITNGKFTITYDKEYLTYSDDIDGDLLTDSDVTTSIRTPDSTSSNPTSEGEIVYSFASADSFEADGYMLDLYFTVNDNAKKGDTFDIKITVDELTNNGTSVNSKVVEEKITVKAEDTDDEDDEDDTEETTSQKQSTKSTTSTGSTTSNTSTTTKSSNAKTNDSTSIFPWVVAALLAVLILGGLYISKKKNKK